MNDLNCDICSKSVDLTASLILPGLILDEGAGKTYTVCGFCQFRLSKALGVELKVSEGGFLIQEIRNGYGYIDMGKVMPKVKELMAENYAKVN